MRRVDRHRKYKRELEVLETIQVLQQDFPQTRMGKLNILEVGAGACDQIEHLEKIGRVTATDIYTHERIKNRPISFIECSITSTPFQDGSFDMIYANHVIAHIGEKQPHNLKKAFEEMRRIGTQDCLYTFTVPTPLWLWLSIFAHYYVMVKGLFRRLGLQKPTSQSNTKPTPTSDNEVQSTRRLNWYQLLLPRGLGTFRTFCQANKGFRSQSWEQLFNQHGLKLISQYPLAVYSASEFPVVPTTRWFNRFNIASSRLFILQKK